jgi:AAHS family 4-hydroxybenzoate transporter-like MFS transporter
LSAASGANREPAPRKSHGDDERLDVAAVIDGAAVGGLQVRVFGLCLSVSMLDGFDTQSIAYAAPSISRDLNFGPHEFGLLFSATMAGTAIGAAVLGRIADRFGRRALITAAVTIFGLMTLGCAGSRGFLSLSILRFLAGLGLGGAIPNFIALASEFAPARSRSRLIVVTLWGFPAGAVLGGLISGPLIDRFGWPAVFVFGGSLPLILAPILWIWLPESIRYLTLRGNAGSRVAATLRRIDPGRAFSDTSVYSLPENAGRSARLIEVFEGRLAAGTLLLGGALCMSLLLAYLLVYWIPLLFQQLGMSMGDARLGTVALNAGGIAGSYMISRAMDRSPLKLAVLIGFYVAAAAAVAAMGIPDLSRWEIMTATAAVGFFLIGNQMSLSAFIADYYPSALRATGLGVTQAMGRCGSLIGPLLAGQLVAAGVSASQIFRLGAVPALIVVGALMALNARRPVHLGGGAGDV